MDILNQRRQGSVTERLSARLDEIDPVIGRMLKNEAKLIADALTTDHALAITADLLRSHQQRLDHLALFTSATLLQRLRWVVTGRIDAPSHDDALPSRGWLF